MKLYLSATLLNNWFYYINSLESQEETAKESFFNCLNKIKTEPTPKMLRGLQFEQDVENVSQGLILTDDNTVYEISQIVKGGLYQEPVKKFLLNFKNYEIWLYGICDFVKANIIYDVKRVDKYNIGKYLNSFQHLIYLFCADTQCFKYLVSDGYDVYIEDYYKSPISDNKLLSGALDFLNWLEINNLFDVYREKWQFDKKD